MGSRPRRAVFAALLAAPLVALGVCGAVAPFVVAAASCSVETEPADCCSRSSAPSCPRTPAPDRCAACGAAAFAFLVRERGPVAPGRGTTVSTVEARPGVARCFDATAARRALIVLAESPPKVVLLATFRN